jgi:hypothetical protein
VCKDTWKKRSWTEISELFRWPHHLWQNRPWVSFLSQFTGVGLGYAVLLSWRRLIGLKYCTRGGMVRVESKISAFTWLQRPTLFPGHSGNIDCPQLISSLIPIPLMPKEYTIPFIFSIVQPGHVRYPFEPGTGDSLGSPSTLRTFEGCTIVKTWTKRHIYYEVLFFTFL